MTDNRPSSDALYTTHKMNKSQKSYVKLFLSLIFNYV